MNMLRKRHQEKVDRHKALLKAIQESVSRQTSMVCQQCFSDPTDPRSSRIEEDAYSVYIDSSKVHMELEKKRYINVMWLPGQEEWYGNSHKVF